MFYLNLAWINDKTKGLSQNDVAGVYTLKAVLQSDDMKTGNLA